MKVISQLTVPRASLSSGVLDVLSKAYTVKEKVIDWGDSLYLDQDIRMIFFSSSDMLQALRS